MARDRRLPVILTTGLALALLGLLIGDQWVSARSASSGPVRVVRWRDALEGETEAARKLIRSQVDAFRHGDYARARSLQSAALHRKWKNDGCFREVIEAQYPEFAACREVLFGRARATADGSVLQIPVRVTGENNHTVSTVYILIREEGGYHVDGVLGGAGPEPVEASLPSAI